MAVINTNYLAQVSQNNLNKSQNSLGTAIERLSSGLRINSAKDDAAGQAIANRFTANVNGLTQAARNANDGISIAQTTEGSLNEINENLQRIRTLTVQASTGSNSHQDLQSIQNEIQERMDEINRVSSETQFNGKYVLGTDGDSLSIQVGAHDNQVITINLKEINANTLGLNGFSVANSQPALGQAVTEIGDGTAAPKAPAFDFVDLNTKFGLTGDKALKEGDVSLHNVLNKDGTASGQYAVKVGNDSYAATVDAAGDVKLSATTATITDGRLNDAEVELTETPIKLAVDAAGTLVGTINYQGKSYKTADLEDGATTIAIDKNGKSTEDFVGSATQNPLAALDKALQDVDDLRSHLGAIQNRFQSTIANLNNTVNNLSAARSRIEDADYAVEVSNMTRAQILQQAGTSVLAQANQVPQTVLSLLR